MLATRNREKEYLWEIEKKRLTKIDDMFVMGNEEEAQLYHQASKFGEGKSVRLLSEYRNQKYMLDLFRKEKRKGREER